MRCAEFAWGLLLIGAAVGRAAEAPAPPLIQRACDMITASTGEKLLGIRLDDGKQDSVRLLAGRAWLRANAPKAYKAIAKVEAEQTRAATEKLIDRLKQWRERRKDEQALVGYLDRKLESASNDLAALDRSDDDDGPARVESQLVFVDMPRQSIKRQQSQSPQRRALLALAWEHRIAAAEEVSAAELAKRLKAQKIDPAEAQPDLSDRVPPQELSDRQWSAKMGLVEFSLLGKPHYQGTDSKLFDSADGRRPGLDQLLGGLRAGGIEELLKLAGGESPEDNQPAVDDNAADTVLEAAKKAGTTGVRITQLNQDALAGKVTVRERFMALMPDGNWVAVWDHTESADANQSRPEAEQEIAADPQVAEAVAGLKELGFGGGQELFDKAIRHGAATLEAQRAADRSFGKFLLRSTRRLDGPTAWSGE
jgi:hypothetical protein